MTYLNVDEVETALTIAAATYPSFTQLILLPNVTWEARICHAVKLGRPSGAEKPAAFFLGGVHAREWGSADILINFVNQLQAAYQTGAGLTFGAQAFTSAQIQDIIDTLDIIVFPQANPDGRHYSMTVEAMWRKNRRTAAPNSVMCPGVDINRNFDFLWDFATHFAPMSGVRTSSDPCNYQAYCGPAAFSEPETQNCKWIFDTYPAIKAFIDLHSFGPTILYSWSDDEDQTADATKNFRNPAYDGLRGIPGDAYSEYLPPTDSAKALGLATTLATAIQAVRGTNYVLNSSFNLYRAPVSGASDDYAYSRHFVDRRQRNIMAFTIEWGSGPGPLQFYPPYAVMMNIIPEITSGLVAFCLDLCNEENAMAWQNRGNSGTNPSTDFVGTIDNEPVVIRSNGSEAMRVTSAGNVGIGIPAPARKLHVGGDAMISGGAMISGVAIGTDAPAVNYQYEYETVGVANPAFNLRLQSPNSIVCHTGTPTPLPRLTIDGSGNVGIGTNIPLFRLHATAPGGFGPEDANGVAQAGNVPVVAQSDSTAIGILNRIGRPVFALNIEGNLGASNARGFPIFYDRYDGNWHPSLSLKNGNVGIGLNDPVGKCEIHSTGPNQTALTSRSSGDGWGIAGAATGIQSAVFGAAEGPSVGVQGHATQTTNTSFGVLGTLGPVLPVVQSNIAGGVAVVGYSQMTVGVGGVTDGGGSISNGVEGLIKGGHGAGVHGSAENSASSVGVYGDNATVGGQAARFLGDVAIQGGLTVSGKAFRIDHPLDPEHKYLTHSSVESPEMLTVYNGVVVTGDDDLAIVTLPDYFQALNRDFTYQLTVVGEFAQAIIADEIEDNSFTIRTDRPHVKVSWQVTGVRHDRYAEANRITVEEEKADTDRGRYLHPELYELTGVGREAVKPIGHIEAMFAGSITEAH